MSGRVTSMVLVEVVDAGGEEQVLARGQGGVDVGRGVAGPGDVELADRAVDGPAVWPLAQVMPVVFVCRLGTKTK